MTREEAKEILEEVKVLDDSMYQYNPAYLEALEMAIAALKCVADMAKYLTDPNVTWRDISDDCITEIMIEHGFMTKEEGD